jgi:hypothetical protein
LWFFSAPLVVVACIFLPEWFTRLVAGKKIARGGKLDVFI